LEKPGHSFRAALLPESSLSGLRAFCLRAFYCARSIDAHHFAAILILQQLFSQILKNAKLSTILRLVPAPKTLEKASPVLPYEVLCQNSRKTPHYPA
jgi:hypothetical protein